MVTGNDASSGILEKFSEQRKWDREKDLIDSIRSIHTFTLWLQEDCRNLSSRNTVILNFPFLDPFSVK